MEHALVDLAPGRQRSMQAVVEAQADRSGARWPSRSSRSLASAGRPVRHRHEAARLRADMREFEAALARWTR